MNVDRVYGFIPASEYLSGRRAPRFVIRGQHTVYEWSMIYTDRHPLPDDYSAGVTAADMLEREKWLGAHIASRLDRGSRREQEAKRRRHIAGEVYRQIRAEIQAGQLQPLKRAYCADTGQEDFTAHTLDITDVLALAERRRDAGRRFGAVLARE